LKKQLQISVRELVEWVLRSGDLVFEFGAGGLNRSLEGIRGHQKLQKSRPDEYEKEVTVSHRLETDGFVLDIGGRIDGIYRLPDRVIVEEIKTTNRSLESLKEEENKTHRAQVNLYGYIYAEANHLDEVTSRLTYYHIDSGNTLELDRVYSLKKLEAFFRDLVNRYLEWARTIEEWAGCRDASIRSLDFPFAAYRPGQRQMALSVYYAIKKGDRLIIQASTGIGKTMAVLFPAIKTLAEGYTRKLFYLTARTTGRTVAEKSLEEMRSRGLKLKSLTLTAKEKICFNPDKACHPEECAFARGYFDRLNDALEEMFRQDAFNRGAIEEAAQRHRICPFEFSLELSLWADCIICDFNYAFDPNVYLKRFFQDDGGGEYTFLVDEAHNLVDRSRQMFSAELHKQSFMQLRRTVKDRLPFLYKAMGKINGWFNRVKREWQTVDNEYSQPEPPEALYPLLGKFCKVAETWLIQNIRTPLRQPVMDLYFEVMRFLKAAELYDDSYATCFQAADRDLKVKLFCIDPSVQLGEALKRGQAAVFFSATMTPLHYFQHILGCGASAKKLVFTSPFPRENLCLLAADHISTRYAHREQTKSAVCRTIVSLVKQKQGNYLLFFPSYQYLTMVLHPLAEHFYEGEIIVQAPGMGEPEREAFLDRFTRDHRKTLVGFAVMGGIFGEGIDLVGDHLTGAVIVGVGLPGIGPERNLIRQYFGRHLGAGYEYAYLYPGFNRVQQAAGRVIRTEQDRGVVLLIGDRFRRHQYHSLFPPEWQPNWIKSEEQVPELLQRFWNPS
jgi:DNA excision repair protein ERCC-2